MTNITVGKKDEMVMKILHYFVTEENYRPIIVNGVQNEIWLENLDNDISLIRININYIHNEEQLATDLRKANAIRKSIKKKTYSFKMNVLNILLDVREEVPVTSVKDIESIKISKIGDLKKNRIMNEFFPDFKEKVISKTTGVMGMFQMTEELNDKTISEDKKLAKVFKESKAPILTMALILINVLVYFFMMFNYESFVQNLGNHFVYLQRGEVWRLITSMFLHGDVIHLMSNMLALYMVGPMIEKYYGKGKYAIIYFVSGIIGNLLSAVLGDYFGIGASGAIFGLFGALMYFGYKYRATLDGFLRSGIVPVIVLNLILSVIVPGIDFYGHIGGLLGGVLITYTLGVTNKSDLREKINGIIITVILVLFLVYMLINK